MVVFCIAKPQKSIENSEQGAPHFIPNVNHTFALGKNLCVNYPEDTPPREEQVWCSSADHSGAFTMGRLLVVGANRVG